MISELEKYPQFKSKVNEILFLDGEVFKSVSSDTQVFDYANDFSVRFSPKLIKLIMSDPALYTNLVDIFENQAVSHIRPTMIQSGDLITKFPNQKSAFVRIVKKMFNDGLLWDVPGIQKKLDYLIAKTSTKSLKDTTELFETHIDGKRIRIPVVKLVNFLESGFKDIYYTESNNKKVENLTLNEFAYVLKEFIYKRNIFEYYIFPNDSLQFRSDLTSDKVANTAHFNRINKTSDYFSDEVVVNKKLLDSILIDMPNDFSKLEQAIYVYIKLCQTLTYDPEFYASNQQGESAALHEDIYKISEVTPTNPQIVCYEFNQIYGKFLSYLNINYETNTSFMKEVYGKGHANLVFKIDDFIVAADSVKSILNGDLFAAKIHDKIEGLECRNYHPLVVKQFNTVLNKVYDHIKTNEPNPYLQNSGFDSWLSVYNSLSPNTLEVEAEEKFEILGKQLKQLSLPTIENFSYLLKLTKSLFGKDAKNSQFEVIIANERTGPYLSLFTPIAFLVHNKNNDIKLEPSSNTLYIYNQNGELFPTDLKTLTEGFSSGKYNYLQQHNEIIPGIPKKGVKHKC